MSDRHQVENRILKKTIKDILWMAAEYAKKVGVFAPYVVNQAIDVSHRYHIPIGDQRYIADKYLGHWNPYTQCFELPRKKKRHEEDEIKLQLPENRSLSPKV